MLLERVAVDDEQVGLEAGLDGADLLLQPQQLGVDHGRGLQRLQRREARLDEGVTTSRDARATLCGP